MLTYQFLDPDQLIQSDDFLLVESFLESTQRTEIGWHYITDLTWIYSQVKHWPRHYNILDAGGGLGPLQFLLAELGYRITNIDMVLRPPPIVYPLRYNTRYRKLNSFVPTRYLEYIAPAINQAVHDPKQWLKEWVRGSLPYRMYRSRGYRKPHNQWRKGQGLDVLPLGRIDWVAGNLCHMPEIPADSFDAIVSLSALEHIPGPSLDAALLEIKRVLKIDARWAVTTSATEQLDTWFHEPSKGYCFSADDIERCFDATAGIDQQASLILDKYRNCQYLQTHLAQFYKQSGKFGMPWGMWDPKYIPVGLLN